MRSRYAPRLILVLTSFSIALVCSGCNPVAFWADLRAPEIYVPEGHLVELRGPHKIKVWTHDSQGNPVRGYVNAHDRYLIGPATKGKDTPSPSVTPKKTTAEDDAPELMAEIASGIR